MCEETLARSVRYSAEEEFCRPRFEYAGDRLLCLIALKHQRIFIGLKIAFACGALSGKGYPAPSGQPIPGESINTVWTALDAC
jgi:hypothetical protein